jgi:hypothetical protein
MRGGARINSGPPPDPNALRRERRQDRDGWTTLPAGGWDGAVPRWPLANMPEVEGLSRRERKHWREVWRTPQAVAWHRLGWSTDVALYCRYLALGETGELRAAAEARAWSDRLGLNPAAMLRLRWRVSVDQVAAQRAAAAPRRTPPGQSARDRLKALEGEGA